jgi:hypothetical protein
MMIIHNFSNNKTYYAINKKFCEELIVYFPFTSIWVPDTMSRKKTLVYMHKENNKKIQLLLGVIYEVHCWDGMIYILSFMKIRSGIQIILRVLPQQSERL